VNPLTEALACLKAGDVAGARDRLVRLLADDPENGAAHALMGACRLQMGDVDGAVTDLEAALERLPDDTATRANLATARRVQAEGYLDAGDMEAARDGFLAALDLMPDDGAALFGLAMAEQERGHYGDALAVLDAYLDAEPDDARAHLNRAFCLQEERRLDDALAAYRTAVGLDRSLYAEAVKGLTTASHGVLWHKTADLKRALGLIS